MKIKTTFLLIASFLLITGNMMLEAQPTEVWNQTHPTWNATGSLHYNYRGIDFNPANNHLYVAGNVGAAATAADNIILILDGSTGDVIDSLTLEPLSLVEMGYGIKDVEVDNAGGIYAISTTQNRFHPLKLFYWASEEASPVQLWVDFPQRYSHSLDFSGGFDVNGDFNDEALIVIPFQNEDSLYYFEASNGDLGDLKLMGLGVAGNGGTKAHVQALGTTMASGFWYNNSELQTPTLFDGTGTIVGSINPTLFTGTTGGVKQFTAGSNTFLEVSNAGNVIVFDITGAAADFSDVDATDIVASVAGTASPPSSIHGYGQEEAIVGNPDGSYAIFSFSGYRYTKLLATEGAPIATGLMLTGSPMAGEIKTAEYTYLDFNGDAEGTSEIKWYVSDNADGSAATEIAGSAGSTTYTLDAGDAGKYIYYTILPVATTGTTSDPLHLATSNVFGPVLASETAPEASNSSISGTLAVGEELTASYTFSDAGGDLEGESMYMWYRTDDDQGTNPVEVGSGSLTYTVAADDAGKYMMFVVTPVAATGWPLVGENDTAFSASAILFPPKPPEASNAAISGREEVGGTLTASYDYSDINGDLEGESIYKWYRSDDSLTLTNEVVVASDTLMYKLVAADEAKYIRFEVTPVTEGGEEGDSIFVVSNVIGAEPPPTPPVASDVVLSGTPEVLAVLSATYTYSDDIDDPEGESIYKWYWADDDAGTNQTLIDGADDQTFLVTEAQLGKHIAFEVTPVAISGGALVGDPVMSNYTATATVVSSQTFGLERLWLASTKTGAAPYYINPSVTTERGFAVGEQYIYIASRYGDTKVIAIDKTDGSFAMELSTKGISGGIYPINDIEVSDDGQILAAPLNDAPSFWIYKWENELADPVKWLEVTLPESMRFGDKFSVTGDLTGDAIIMAARANGAQIVRWVVTGGIPGEAEILTLNGLTSMETSPAAVPFSPSVDAHILIDGKGLAPRIFDKDLNQVGSIPLIDDYAAYKIQSNSPNVFEYKGRTMAAFFQAMRQEPLGARIIVADITAEPYQIIDSTEYISNSMAWDGYIGEVDVTTDGEYYYAYMLQAKNAVAAYRGTLELPQFVSAITSHAGDQVTATFDMAMAATGNTNAAVWSIKEGAADVAIDTIYSTDDHITFVLATAITEGTAVTIAYNGNGTISSFNGMPLAAFGPEDVENIVGAEPPVASDVVITGEAKEGAVLTGTYTYTDPEGDPEGESLYQWYEATSDQGADLLKILGEKSITYTATSDVAGKYVAFEVTPVASTGGADYLVGEPVMSAFVLIDAADKPVASDVSITGEAKEGAELTGVYTYSDDDGDAEGTSLYKWYQATSDQGADQQEIAGETGITYTATAAVAGKYVAFEVTPVAATGGVDYLVGDPVMSAFVYIVGTGIENTGLHNVLVYPNPVVDILTIDNCESVRNISVIDVTGKVMQSVESNYESKVSIPMDNCSKGIYYLKLYDETGASNVVRVVKVQ